MTYALTRDREVRLALNNVLDKPYETVWYYNQPGRNVMLTLRNQLAS